MFPCKPGAKEPVGGRGHLDASIDPAQIHTWWDANPHANIGIAVAPSGLVVLDVDTAEGKPGLQSLSEIDAQLPDTLTARTGRGGYHGVFVRPADMPAARRIGFKPGLDLLGDGYFVAAPSVLTNGMQYRWERLIQPALLPQVLRDVTSAPRAQVKAEIVGAPIISGSRNTSLFRLGCALRNTGIGAEALARALDAENKSRFKPPVDDFELGTIVNHVLTTVQVRHDVAANAIVEQDIHAMFAPPAAARRSMHIRDVGLVPIPAQHYYSTGFARLDDLTAGGFATQQLSGIIGPPSTGKSALVGHWLIALAKHRVVLHCSLELLRHELFVRYASHELGFPWRDGMKGKVDQAAMLKAIGALDIRLIGAEDVDREDPLGSILAEAELIKQETGVAPIIAIDYIQLMARGASTEMRHKVGELTQRCRRAAQHLDTVVLGVFTTQRMSYSGKAAEQLRAANDPTAYLGAAKESGDIEFDCATLLYLDVDKLHEGVEKPARIAVARCRQGDVGFVGLRAKLDVGSFAEDPGALAEFDADNRKAKKEADTLENDCARLLDAIDALPNQAWTAFAKHAKLDNARAKTAKEKLIEDGVIEQSARTHHGRTVPNSFTLERRNARLAPDVVLEDHDHED